MDDFMKTEAKDIISTGIEKASGATGINIEVSITVAITRGIFKLRGNINTDQLILNNTNSLCDIQFACKFVKDSMDRQFGPCWHCVMGEGFSFEITRQAKTTLYMYYGGKIAVLLFKC